MRANISFLTTLLLVRSAVAPPPSKALYPPKPDVEEPHETTFDGQVVPPMIMLNGTTFKEDVHNGYWLIEAYSPYCHHCTNLAPKLQTIYEFYYTSEPFSTTYHDDADPLSSLDSFTSYYDLKFAKVDCVAWGTTCSEPMKITTYPTLALYKDGQEVRRSTGDKSMKHLSDFIEECLESIRPGTRPEKGVKLPEVGAKERPDQGSSKDKGRKGNDAQLKETEKPKTTTGGENSKTTVTATPNPSGKSVDMNRKKFEKLVEQTGDPWWIKFYAPWCPHCQKLAPTWSSLARDMKGRLNIGEVNCDFEVKLCKDMHVGSYPTLLFIKGKSRMPYQGLRGLGDLVDYAEKAIVTSAGVPEVTKSDFEELEKNEEVIFTYFFNEGTTSEDFTALEQLPVHLTGRAKIVKTTDAGLADRFRIVTWPQLMVSKDGKPTYYPGTSPSQIRNTTRMIDWMQSNWLPLVPEITSTNAQEVMENKFVVLGILNHDRTKDFERAKHELKLAATEWFEREKKDFQNERQELRDAKQLRIEEAEDRKDENAIRDAKLIKVDMEKIKRQRVAFAWVDGVFWERWVLSTFGVSAKDEDKVVIYDNEHRLYWDTTITGLAIRPSRSSILETLPKVVSSHPQISPHVVGSSISHFFFRISYFCRHHPLLALIGFSVSSASIYIFWKKASRRRRSFGSMFNSLGNEKNGLLGSNGALNGKAD